MPFTKSESVRLELHLFALGPLIMVVVDDDFDAALNDVGDDDVDVDVDVDDDVDGEVGNDVDDDYGDEVENYDDRNH